MRKPVDRVFLARPWLRLATDMPSGITVDFRMMQAKLNVNAAAPDEGKSMREKVVIRTL